MMKNILLSFLVVFFVIQFTNAQTTHQISADGFTYNPNLITIQVGDMIEFTVGAMHPTVEVSEATWNANGSTALDGGFSAPNGTETIEFSEAGTYYYVCQNHVSSGMKGRILVEEVTDVKTVETEIVNNISVYPNPVQSYADLNFSLTKQENVTVTLYNLLGSRIKVLHNNLSSAGNYDLSLNFSDLPSGIYYLNVETASITRSIKIVK